MTLPADISQFFFETLHGDRSVLEFEQRVYNEKRLEGILNSDDYLDLISYDFKNENAEYGLKKMLEKWIDKGAFEKWRLHKLLIKALSRDRELPDILIDLYRWYCKGYSFLENLGLGYGLAVKVPIAQADSWDELTEEQQQRLLDSFYPQLEVEIHRVLNWLDKGSIVLTGQQNEDNYFEYIDNRTEDEKRQ